MAYILNQNVVEVLSSNNIQLEIALTKKIRQTLDLSKWMVK